MQRQSWIGVCLVTVFLTFALGYFVAQPGGLPAANIGGGSNEIHCYFSPKGGCTDAVVAEIDRATRSVRVQAYSFTSQPIAQALVRAQQRGVPVTVVLDKSQRTEARSEAGFVWHADIATYIDDRHAIAHNKIMLIDGETILTGSFNFTNQAERSNAENLLVIHGQPQLFAAYEANFRAHLEHSQVYDGMGAPAGSNNEFAPAAEASPHSHRRRR